MYFFIPKRYRPKSNININYPVSHIDLFPTLYNLTLSNQEYINLGRDLFSERVEQRHHFRYNDKVISDGSKACLKSDISNCTNIHKDSVIKGDWERAKGLVKAYQSITSWITQSQLDPISARSSYIFGGENAN